MKKTLIALFVLVFGFAIASFSLTQQPTYAGVHMPNATYKSLMANKKSFNTLLKDLSKFRHNKDKTLATIKTDALKLQDHLNNLSATDKNNLTRAFYSQQGLITTLENADQKEYNIDGAVASQLHANLNQIITLIVANETLSSNQREKVVAQFQKETNLDQFLYQISEQNE